MFKKKKERNWVELMLKKRSIIFLNRVGISDPAIPPRAPYVGRARF